MEKSIYIQIENGSVSVSPYTMAGATLTDDLADLIRDVAALSARNPYGSGSVCLTCGSVQSVIDALESGETLADFGEEDADQEAIEWLHAVLVDYARKAEYWDE